MIETKCSVYPQPATIRGVFYRHAYTVRVTTFEPDLPMVLISDTVRRFPTQEQAMQFAETVAR